MSDQLARESSRLQREVRRSRRGAFVVVVGPDGSGKTTAARELMALFDGPTAYFHFRPLVTQPMIPVPPAFSVPPPTKGSLTGSKAMGWIRLVRNVVRFWAGHFLRVLPAVRRGTLVVGDRWAYGYIAQSYALKFYGPRWLARLAIWVLPEPDLVANLVAPPDIIHARKQELPSDEIRSELELWSNLPAKNLVDIDAGLKPEEVAAAIRAGMRQRE